MSTPHSPPDGTLPQEPESLPYGKITVVALITLFTFAVGVVWSTAILNRTNEEMHPKTDAQNASIGAQPEVGIVNVRMFELDNRAEEKRDLQKARLSSYGWVDKEKKIAHIPVERAMELMVSEQKK